MKPPIDITLGPATRVRRSFELLDVVEVRTDEQHVRFTIGPRGARAAAELGASLLASARRQEQEG